MFPLLPLQFILPVHRCKALCYAVFMLNIEATPEVTAYLKRCRRNLTDSRKNAFVGRRISPAGEHRVQKAMAKAGFAEFAGPEAEWPSLYLSAAGWMRSPYHAHIRLDGIRDGHFSYKTVDLEAYELFNADAVQPDPKRELNDWMKLRALDAPCPAIFLSQDGEPWMMDAPSEAATNDVPARNVHGRVLTFGLGIGYFVYMAMQNPAVTAVTVVEKSADVIAMFNRFLKPQFPDRIPLNLIEADAFAQWQPDVLAAYDYVYADIWRSSEDGLEIITRLLEQSCPPKEKADFWIESSCMETMWALVYLYLDGLVSGHPSAVQPQYQRYQKKISAWFAASTETVHDPKRLAELIYDPETLRRILALPL